MVHTCAHNVHACTCILIYINIFSWDNHINLYSSHTHTSSLNTHPYAYSLSLYTHTHTQRSDALEQLQRELEALKNRLQGEHENRQRDHDASQAAKDAIIDQLRRELHDTQARLNEAENKIVELTTSKAAEIVSQSTSMYMYSDVNVLEF